MQNSLLIILCAFAAAQGANYGSDFYIGTMRNYQANTVTYKLHLSTLETSSVTYTIEDYDGTQLSTGAVSRNTPTVVSIPVSYVTNWNTERYEGLHLSSTGPISVLVVNYQYATISEYPAYPKQEFALLNYEYYISTPDTNLVSSAYSEVLLVGTVDGTTVTITPTENVYVPSDVQNINSQQVLLLAGETKQFTLNRLQTFYFGANSYADLTGTSVVSSKPLTVISGNECANVPASMAYCEHVEEQIPPTTTWGKKYLLRAYVGKTANTYFLAVSSEDGTTLQHNCGSSTVQSVSLAHAGDKTTFSLHPTTDVHCYAVSDKPILITQMMAGGVSDTGDPAVSVISPIEQYTKEVVFHTPDLDQNLEDNHINILMQNKDTLTMDGSPLTVTWENIVFNGQIVGYSATVQDLTVAVHDIKSNTPFSVLVYGFTQFALAGYSFSANVGILEQLVGGKLQVKPWYGNILGGTAFILKGPAFSPSDVIQCQFNELYLPCERIDEEYAMCVSPRLTFTRRITLRLFTNGDKYITDSRFYSLGINEDSLVNVMDFHFFLTSTQQVTLVWDQNKVIPTETGIDASTLLLNITLYELKHDNAAIIEKISQVATNVQNSGQTQVTIPVMTETDDVINNCLFSVTVYDNNNQKTIVSDVDSEIGQWCTNVWVAFSQPDEIDDILFNQCNKWAALPEETLPFVRNELLDRTRDTPCPPTRARARTPNSGLVKDTLDGIVHFFHPGADECYRQRTITAANMGSGNECCYSASGNLIVGPKNGGSINKVDRQGTDQDYWTTIQAHFKEDIVPYLFCCTGKKQNCKAYYDRRPSDDGSRFSPPVPACVYGDPHIVTLDLFKYTFNGKGEFVLVETFDVEPSFTLHARMVPVKDSNNNDGKATVFSAIAVKQQDSDTVQFELQDSEDDIKLVTYIDGEEIDFSELTVQEFNNVTVTDTGNNTLNAIFSTGAYITVAELEGLISTLVVYLPDMYREKTQGLMGNYNNDTTDDLLRKGTTLPLSPNAGLKQIHDWVGMSFIIANEADGIFTYNNDDSFERYYDPDFVPIFDTTFATDELEQEAIAICGEDKFCLYDIAVTGKTEIGKNTKQGSDDFEMLQELSKPVVCDPPCVQGACVDNNICICSEGYMGTLCDQMNTTVCGDFNPCENGATCGMIAGSVVCMCSQGYIGYFCEEIDPLNPPTTSTEISIPMTSTTSMATNTAVTSSTSSPGRGSRSQMSSAPTQRPTRTNERLEGGSDSSTIYIVIAVVAIVGGLAVVGVIILVAVLISKRRKATQKKYPVESEMMRTGDTIGKANPAYEQMEEEEGGERIYEDMVDESDEKKLVD